VRGSGKYGADYWVSIMSPERQTDASQLIVNPEGDICETPCVLQSFSKTALGKYTTRW
jgi:hypothetical protein